MALLDRRPIAWTALAIVSGLVAGSTLRPIWDPDLGWHLALGRTIVEQRGVPDAEPFTHTACDAAMVAHEWASQVVCHAVVEVDLDSRMFNPAGGGGYVLLHPYQKYPIFIDGRWVTVGKRVTRDALRIERRLPGTFEKLDTYGVDLLLVPRGWMTDRIAEERSWIPVFENWNAGV